MGQIDKRKKLDEEIFTYRLTKNNTVFIDYKGKQVMILKGKEAEKIMSRINSANSEKEVQLILAKVTGNFKRGNERSNSNKN
ncbi:hypothetical protein [Bacillus sp. NEB1478]|uniref:hypothetical protein n=1 Tax=Bacillus sp. NEB1478 TaxID=3073816 RepID=UPI0028735B61|nr:hypothetical protein [Bacillus sp. NEB1478]WNB90886.1 hypothetical protein RGB74_13305 [Bacillus sp. NEB1478]